MTCEVDPKFLVRWAEIYLDKSVAMGEAKAFHWFNKFVPDRCKAATMVEVKKLVGRRT